MLQKKWMYFWNTSTYQRTLKSECIYVNGELFINMFFPRVAKTFRIINRIVCICPIFEPNGGYC